MHILMILSDENKGFYSLLRPHQVLSKFHLRLWEFINLILISLHYFKKKVKLDAKYAKKAVERGISLLYCFQQHINDLFPQPMSIFKVKQLYASNQ